MVLGKGRLVLVLISVSLCLIKAQEEDSTPDCPPCDRSSCPEVGACISGILDDVCGCCRVCARSLGQRCDTDDAVVHSYGTCGQYLSCRPRTDIGDISETTCECEIEGEVCGSDSVTYETLCHLLEKIPENPTLTVVTREPCLTVPVIKSRPRDAIRPLGSIMVLDCEAIGFPVPELSWELNKADGSSFKLPSDNAVFAIQIRGGPEKHMVTSWAQVMRIEHDSIGTYTCVATNSQGEARAAATISLRPEAEMESVNEI